MKTKRCGATTRAGRLAKAKGFFTAAETVGVLDDEGSLVDATVTLYVHAGIAAADVLCCARLGEHAQGQDHGEAVALLAKVDADASKHLRRLLGLKTKAGYSAVSTSITDARTAARSAAHLVGAAEAV